MMDFKCRALRSCKRRVRGSPPPPSLPMMDFKCRALRSCKRRARGSPPLPHLPMTVFKCRALRSCKRRKLSSGMADWSKLPTELLNLVVKRLPFLSDFIRFGAVCWSWRSVQTETRQPAELPWLVLCQDDNDKKTRSFFSLSENKTYRLKLPELIGKRCVGSSLGGWLITIDRNLQVDLLHPFLGRLIPLPTPPPYDTRLENTRYTAEFLPALTILKAIMSSDPVSSPEDCVVLAIDGMGKLLFCRPGDKQWTKLNDRFMYYYDVIYYERQFFGITTQTKAVVISDLGPDPEIKEFASRLRNPGLPPDTAFAYLVESMGDLLQVIRNRVNMDGANRLRLQRTSHFEVFKLDRNTKNWVEMKSLGDRALFLGYGASMSFLAHNYPGCKENAIYFTDDDEYKTSKHGYKDLGIYNLGDRMVEPYYPSDAFHPALSPPLWLIPSPIINREASSRFSP